MKGTTHLAAGIVVGLVVAQVQEMPLGETALTAGVAGIAALVPDWLQVNMPGLNKTIKGLAGHRGLSHWGLAVLAAYLVALAIVPSLALPVAAGWLSHLVLDAFNAPGVPAFWPFPWRLHLASIRSGGRLDGVLTWLWALLAAVEAVRIVL